MQYGDFEEMLAEIGQEGLQALVDGGFVFSDIAGSEALVAESGGGGDEEQEEEPRGWTGRGRGGGRGGRGRGRRQEREGGGRTQSAKGSGRKGTRKLKGRSKKSAYAPD